MNWVCSQIGAREHYAIPRVLNRGGRLELFYTDFWAGPLWRVAGWLLNRPSLVARYHEDLAAATTRGFNFSSLCHLLPRRTQQGNPYDNFLDVGHGYGMAVRNSLKRHKAVAWPETIFFGYDTGFLEPAQWVKDQGGRTIVCQMDPSRAEVDLVREEERRWPGWAKQPVTVPEAYFQRREQEWATADLVMVNSEWTKVALIGQGVPDQKIIVVPLAFEGEEKAEIGERNSEPPIRALFLGQVILRKGIQYLMEAAKMLDGEPVHFDVVGPIGISSEAVASAPANMTFHGPVNRDRTAVFYHQADVFVLPTLSDGFALTQLEAMAHGLPVITTPNCGAVVTGGVDGWIVPAGDAVALTDAVRAALADPSARNQMSKMAVNKANSFSLQRLGERLADIENRLVGEQAFGA